jgi:hypothetical protein
MVEENNSKNQIDSGSTLFAVLKLSTTIKYDDPFSGEEITTKLNGCAGYLPVFNNEKDAKKTACDGKYDIVAIQPKL